MRISPESGAPGPPENRSRRVQTGLRQSQSRLVDDVRVRGLRALFQLEEAVQKKTSVLQLQSQRIQVAR
jgi:hypothetical protein